MMVNFSNRNKTPPAQVVEQIPDTDTRRFFWYLVSVLVKVLQYQPLEKLSESKGKDIDCEHAL